MKKEKAIHVGENIKRFREILGIKQSALACDHGDDWNQKKVSLLEKKQHLEPETLSHISKTMKIPEVLLKKFDMEQIVPILVTILNVGVFDLSQPNFENYFTAENYRSKNGAENMKTTTNYPPRLVYLLPLSDRFFEINQMHFEKFGSSYKKVQCPVEGADFATMLSDDGLAPDFRDGSTVFFQQIDPELFIEWGKVYAVSTKNGLIIKRLNPGSKSGSLLCSCSNPLFGSFEIAMNTSEMYFYKAVASISVV